MTLPFQESVPENLYYKGRGAQLNPKNKYLKNEYAQEHAEGIDEWWQADVPTQILEEHAKTLVNKVDSPDVGMWYSMNPYQGCEHGCIYCYARNAHQFWGMSAGLDFERKIVVKKNRNCCGSSSTTRAGYLNPFPSQVIRIVISPWKGRCS